MNPREAFKDFAARFGGEATELYAAPARVNLIGEHIDYNGGMVFPAALDLRIYLVLRKRDDAKFVLRSMSFPSAFEWDSREAITEKVKPDWANYPLGVLSELAKEGLKIDRGFDGLFISETPNGAGLSSSAAFEVVFAYAVSELNGLGLDKTRIALLSQRAENNFVGMQCGIMDQFASAMGRAGRAILLNCRTLEHRYVPLELGDARLVVINTNKERRLVDSKYNERRKECEEALEALKRKHAISDLCELDEETFEGSRDLLPDDRLLRRARHVVTENGRVKKAVLALEAGDLPEFGRLLRRSHESLRDDYEVTGRELDALSELANGHEGCLGARMTGAGFGGCAIALVREAAVPDFTSRVGLGYADRTGLKASFYSCTIGEGVFKIEM